MEVRLIKKVDIKARFHAKHMEGASVCKDYCKPCSLRLHNCKRIDKIFVCTAAKMSSERLCEGFIPDRQGRCQYQVDGPYRTECLRGPIRRRFASLPAF